MDSSLEKLIDAKTKPISNLQKKGPWLQTNLFFKRKGVYPYEHIENFARFDETQHLQMKKKKPQDYEHAKSIWNKFNTKT